MNSQNHDRTDDLITQGIHELRIPPDATPGMGDAIRAMQAEPVKARPFLKWSLGFGTASIIAIALILGSSLATSNAYAGELQKVALTQSHQKRVYQKAWLFSDSGKPIHVLEFWTDHGRQAHRQTSSDGKLQVAIVADGKLRYSYFPATRSIPTYAYVDEDRDPHFDIETIDSILSSRSFKGYKIAKKSGVKLNGRLCDYYSIANGYYRVWVDPATKLPLQREIHDKGVSLWKRDVYQYPASFSESTFKPVPLEGVTYFDYITARARLKEVLSKPGQSQTVGGVTINLKGVVKDSGDLRVLWSTTGSRGSAGSVEVTSARKGDGKVGDLSETVLASNLLYEELLYRQPFPIPATVRIAAWNKQGRQVGWATFQVRDVITTPDNGRLLRSVSKEPQRAKRNRPTKPGAFRSDREAPKRAASPPGPCCSA